MIFNDTSLTISKVVPSKDIPVNMLTVESNNKYPEVVENGVKPKYEKGLFKKGTVPREINSLLCT